MCASAWTRRGPHGLRPGSFSGGMKAAFVRPPPRDLGVHGASIVCCGLSCLVDLNSDLYRLCGSLHGPDTFWARGFSWINKETTTTQCCFVLLNWYWGIVMDGPCHCFQWFKVGYGHGHRIPAVYSTSPEKEIKVNSEESLLTWQRKCRLLQGLVYFMH